MRHGFTIAELVLGMAVTALVAITVAMAGRTLSSEYDDGEAYTAAVQTARVSMLRLEPEIRRARVLARVTTASTLLWAAKPGSDGTIHISELVLLQYSGGTLTKSQVAFPSSWPDWLTQLCDVPMSLDSLMSNLDFWASVLTWYYPQTTTLADGLTGFDISTIHGLPTDNLVKVHVTAGAGGGRITLRAQIAQRYPASVGQAGGTWVFN